MLFIFLLMILMIMLFYSVYVMYENEKPPKLDKKVSIDMVKFKTKKSICCYTEYNDIKDNNAYVFYYALPINSIYWTVDIFSKSGHKKSVNMSKYKTIEKGDILAIVIGNNLNVVNETRDEIKRKHKKNLPFKKIFFEMLSIDDPFILKFESFSNKISSYDIFYNFSEYTFTNVKYERFNVIEDEINYSQYAVIEDSGLFDKMCKNIIGNSGVIVNVNVNTNELNSPVYCLTNRSDVFIVDGLNTSKYPFKIIALDHFKSKTALHANIKFYNAEDDIEFRIEITSEISDSFNVNGSITARVIEFDIPKDIKSFYAIEYIYPDYLKMGKLNVNTIVPFRIYKLT